MGYTVDETNTDVEQTTSEKPAAKQPFYVIFGHAHSEPGGLLIHSFLMVNAEDELAARMRVKQEIGDQWAFMYTEEEFAGQPEKYNLELWKVIS